MGIFCQGCDEMFNGSEARPQLYDRKVRHGLSAKLQRTEMQRGGVDHHLVVNV